MTNRDASIIGPQIERLATEHGSVTPSLLVESARPVESPIHKYYDWNDKSAAHKWRLEQASYQLRSIVYVERLPDKDGTERDTQVRSFHCVRLEREDDEPKRAYVTLERVRSEEDLLNQVISEAERELLSWTERHRIYQNLKPFKAKFGRIQQEIGRMAAK